MSDIDGYWQKAEPTWVRKNPDGSVTSHYDLGHKLPIDLKNYKAPISLWGRVCENWHWILIVGYFSLVYFY